MQDIRKLVIVKKKKKKKSNPIMVLTAMPWVKDLVDMWVSVSLISKVSDG